MNAIDFDCPVCGAKAGERCHTLTGKANPVSHARRKRAALDRKHPHEDLGKAAAPVAGQATDDE
jgi:hypothetical protein